MDWGLYLEEVQQIAREHGLPTSRTKAELIQELIESNELDPTEVVAYVRVDMLRTILQEMGLPSGAGREVLAERLVNALSAQSQARVKPRRAASEKPKNNTTEAPGASSRVPVTVQVNVPPGPAPIVEVHFPKPERPSAAWGFAGILMTVIVGGILYLGVATWGVEGGVTAAIGGGVALAFALLFTTRRWVPWVDEWAR